ncbi:uncharacterized protein N7479_008884 [Penicillium vulpinum]|uniref:Uncharacterized protein n=1 Tax=Penicillium vulpinum TaxID=29845 RepID=A0A1V6S1G8_9EURO|nr:uncharacterized protein N7479_008884 [Penicillium vulpinum]KAJ5950471.1 hypothetical protein N7479_008884 [Penicillium vulpinum]OQE07696.1 hypothetical protein PENVUL_c012G06469 [Penicillium vulpinum]
MNTVQQGYNHPSCEILQSVTELFLPVTSLVSFSLLGLIFLHRYIEYRRRRQAHILFSEFKEQNEQDYWLQSIIMEKGDIISSDLLPRSACDILQPLSHTSLLPSSGALAAQAREQQSERSAMDVNSPTSSKASSPVSGDEVQKRNESTQQMRDDDAEGGRTWKRVVVEYS